MSNQRKTFQLADILKEVSTPIEMNDNKVYNLASIKRRNGGFFDREKKKGKDILTKTLSKIIPGSFVISKMQVVHGACAMAPNDVEDKYISSSYASFVPKDPSIIDIAYLDAYSHTRQSYDSFLRSCHGVHIEKMTFKVNDWLKEEIELPPLTEQKKITQILFRIDNSISLFKLKLKKIQMLINAFRSSLEDVPDYKIYSLQEIFLEKTIGTSRRGTGPNKNIPLIKMGDIGRGEIKYINNESIEYGIDLDHLILRKGDILFNTRNTPELVGKTAIFYSPGNYTFDNNLMLLRFKEVVDPSFLNQLMNSGRVLKKLFSISSGTTSVAAIYWNDLKKIKLKLPPIDIQEKKSANIESLEKIKLKINNKIEFLKNLKISISSDLLSGNKKVFL